MTHNGFRIGDGRVMKNNRVEPMLIFIVLLKITTKSLFLFPLPEQKLKDDLLLKAPPSALLLPMLCYIQVAPIPAKLRPLSYRPFPTLFCRSIKAMKKEQMLAKNSET